MDNSFSNYAAELKRCLDQKDWAGISEVDKRVREHLSSMTVCDDEHRMQITNILRRYEKIYTLLIQSAEKYRKEISDELSQVTKESKAADVYLDSSRYRG